MRMDTYALESYTNCMLELNNCIEWLEHFAYRMPVTFEGDEMNKAMSALYNIKHGYRSLDAIEIKIEDMEGDE